MLRSVSKYLRKTINVSKNDDVTSQTQQHSHGKQRLKRCVLRRLRKTGSNCADVTCCGRLFHTRAAATGKAHCRCAQVSQCLAVVIPGQHSREEGLTGLAAILGQQT